MDDEYDLRKDNLGKEQKEKFAQLEKLIIPLLVKLAKSPEAYIHWPNRAEVIEAQLKKIVSITRGQSMELYQVKVVADVYADSDWDEIKKDMVIAFKDKDGNLKEMVPGKYESIKIISINNDRYKIKEDA